MKKIMFLFVATIVLGAVGCNKDEVIRNEVEYVSELKVNFDGTRLNATHSATEGLKFVWEDEDEIEIWEDLNPSAGSKIFVYNAVEGVFRPKTNDDRLIVGKSYFAVNYEYADVSVMENKSVVMLELEPDEVLSNVPMITDVFEVTPSGTQVNMHHIIGIVEVPVKAKNEGAKLMWVELDTNESGTPICGDFYISPVAPYAYYNGDENIFEYIYQSIYYPGSDDYAYIDLSTTQPLTIFLPALPGNYSTLNVNYKLVGGEEKTIETNHELVVERGKITKISEFKLE